MRIDNGSAQAVPIIAIDIATNAKTAFKPFVIEPRSLIRPIQGVYFEIRRLWKKRVPLDKPKAPTVLVEKARLRGMVVADTVAHLSEIELGEVAERPLKPQQRQDVALPIRLDHRRRRAPGLAGGGRLR